jgi:hypothetical protein
MDANAAPLVVLASSLDSFCNCIMETGKRHHPETVDLLTAVAHIFLVSDSKEKAEEDYRMIEDLENNYQDLMFEEESGTLSRLLMDLRTFVKDSEEGILEVNIRILDSIPYGKEGLDVAMSFFGMVPAGRDGDVLLFVRKRPWASTQLNGIEGVCPRARRPSGLLRMV